MTPIRDQLVRIALLIGLGLVVAIIAGTIMARRMLVPITALQAGARRLGAGDFGHRIEVKTSDELEELANQFNGMAGQLAETYSGLEEKVKERTRDLANRSTSSRCSRKSAARSSPRSTSTPCCPRSPPVRWKSPMPTPC